MKLKPGVRQIRVSREGGQLVCPRASSRRRRFSDALIHGRALILTLVFCASLASLLPVRPATARAVHDHANLDAALQDARQARARFDYAGALRLLDKAAQAYGVSAELFNEYGGIYLDAEEVQKAQDYFNRALKINPQSEAAIAGRAAVDLMNRDYRTAENRLREYLSQNPRSGRAHALLGLVHFENNRVIEAQAEAEKALAIDADDKDALHVLVLVKVIQKEPNEARKLTERALEIAPLDPDMRRVLAQFVDGRA